MVMASPGRLGTSFALHEGGDTPAGGRGLHCRSLMETATAQPRRILVVDDQEAILFATMEYFKPHGYNVDCALGKIDAQALVNHFYYSLAIIDLRLSGTTKNDGFELVSYIRDRCPETRILVWTAYGSAEIETRAQRLGIDAFVHKIKSLDEVARIVSELLRSHR